MDMSVVAASCFSANDCNEIKKISSVKFHLAIVI
jgi:hypothetical protein